MTKIEWHNGQPVRCMKAWDGTEYYVPLIEKEAMTNPTQEQIEVVKKAMEYWVPWDLRERLQAQLTAMAHIAIITTAKQDELQPPPDKKPVVKDGSKVDHGYEPPTRGAVVPAPTQEQVEVAAKAMATWSNGGEWDNEIYYKEDQRELWRLRARIGLTAAAQVGDPTEQLAALKDVTEAFEQMLVSITKVHPDKLEEPNLLRARRAIAAKQVGPQVIHVSSSVPIHPVDEQVITSAVRATFDATVERCAQVVQEKGGFMTLGALVDTILKLKEEK
jgi:hypothetical protein